METRDEKRSVKTGEQERLAQQAGNTAARQEPVPDKTIEHDDKMKEENEPDHSEFTDWNNILREDEAP